MKNNNKFTVTHCELDYLKEDMFQGKYNNIILDIGYYLDGYFKLFIIKDYNWDNPLEEVSFKDVNLIEKFINIFKDKIENGYYNGNYIKNIGYNKEH